MKFVSCLFGRKRESFLTRASKEVDPNIAWQYFESEIVCSRVFPIDLETPKPENHIRFVCISDTHGRTHTLHVPRRDILLHAGDFSSFGRLREVEEFAEFIASQPRKHKIVIAGNHHLTFDTESYQVFRHFSCQDGHSAQKHFSVAWSQTLNSKKKACKLHVRSHG